MGRKLTVALVAMVLGIAAMPIQASAAVNTQSGSFADGATYLIQTPDNWNGTLLLYSHGYVTPGSPNPALDAGDPATAAYLLSRGYALAGSSYATTGWALEQAIPDQMETLDTFDSLVATPTRTIAWGHSLGGIITAGLLQTHPERFDAAIEFLVGRGMAFHAHSPQRLVVRASDYKALKEAKLVPDSPMKGNGSRGKETTAPAKPEA